MLLLLRLSAYVCVPFFFAVFLQYCCGCCLDLKRASGNGPRVSRLPASLSSVALSVVHLLIIVNGTKDPVGRVTATCAGSL
jgi:hypothetical protein